MIYLVTGGSGSGKSAYAEEKILSFGKKDRIYIATMFAYDEESRERIQRHRRMREGKQFQTIERYTGLASVKVPEGSAVLLECLSNLVANEFYMENGAGLQTRQAILTGIDRLAAQAAELVVVTNEIFSDIPVMSEEMDRYLTCLGGINCALAEQAAEVTEVVYGIPVYHKKEKMR